MSYRARFNVVPTCVLSMSVCVDVDVIRVWMARIATLREGKRRYEGGVAYRAVQSHGRGKGGQGRHGRTRPLALVYNARRAAPSVA